MFCFYLKKKPKQNHTSVIVSSLTDKLAAVDGKYKIPVIFIRCFSLLLPSLSLAGSKVRVLLSQFSWNSSRHPKAWLSALLFLLPAGTTFLWQCLAKTFQQRPWQRNWTSLSDRNYSLFNGGLCMLLTRLSLKRAGCLVSRCVVWVHRISPGTIHSSYSWFGVKLQDWSEWDSPGVCPGFGNTRCCHYWNDSWSRESSY